MSPVIVNAPQSLPAHAAGPHGQFSGLVLPALTVASSCLRSVTLPATRGHQNSTCLCSSSSCQVRSLKPVCEALRSDSGDPGAQSLAPRSSVSSSHPRGLIQALEFKYQPPAQGSCVYVFSSGLSLQPPTASAPGRPVHVFSSLGLKLSCPSPLAAASVLAIPFVSFFLLVARLQSDRNSPLALPSESVQNLNAPCTSFWLLPGCRSAFVWATL